MIATGSLYSYFGHDEWARFAPGVKSIEDARHIRARLLFSSSRRRCPQIPTGSKP